MCYFLLLMPPLKEECPIKSVTTFKVWYDQHLCANFDILKTGLQKKCLILKWPVWDFRAFWAEKCLILKCLILVYDCIWQSPTLRIEVIKRQPCSTVSGVSDDYCVVPDSRLDGRSLIINATPTISSSPSPESNKTPEQRSISFFSFLSSCSIKCQMSASQWA